MASYGVEQDIPLGTTLTVAGTIQLANPAQISQQNTANSVPGLFIDTYATVAANATGTQASGTAILSDINAVTSGGAAYSVTLPVSIPGRTISIILPTATNTVAVFPNAGGTGTETINALSANSGITMGARTSADFVCVVAGQWYTNPRVPS